MIALTLGELGELATRGTGDAHGLDGGRVTAALVLRAAAAAFGAPVPTSATERRELWARLGVSPDAVSGTVLSWGLRPPGDDAWSAMMRQRAEPGPGDPPDRSRARGGWGARRSTSRLP